MFIRKLASTVDECVHYRAHILTITKKNVREEQLLFLFNSGIYVMEFGVVNHGFASVVGLSTVWAG